jgi:hypothetical protein
MAKRNSTLALAALFVMGLVVVASAGIPDPANSTAWADNCGRFTIAPGGGETLIEGANDYTIHCQILDINGNPVSLAATDLTLYHADIVFGAGQSSQADAGTDAGGNAMFSDNPGTIDGGVAGDLSDGIICDDLDLFVMAYDIIINDGNPVCVAVDSPDLNGSLTVTIVDFAKFATDYNGVGTFDSCHDYAESGDTNIADFGIFGQYY